MRDRLTIDKTKIFARENITLMSVTKDELRKLYNEIFDRLQEYEIAEETGQIIVPPYKVGDTVYVIADKVYWKAKVRSVWYRRSEYKEDDLVCVEYEDGEIKSYYGREIYFSKEEAEQALKGGAE